MGRWGESHRDIEASWQTLRLHKLDLRWGYIWGKNQAFPSSWAAWASVAEAVSLRSHWEAWGCGDHHNVLGTVLGI